MTKLDFLAITEHNHIEAENGAEDREDGILIAKTPALYEADNDTSNKGAAKKFTENGRFVAIYGQEFSTISKGNHVNVFEVDRVIPVPKQEFRQLVTWLKTHKDSTGKEREPYATFAKKKKNGLLYTNYPEKLRLTRGQLRSRGSAES